MGAYPGQAWNQLPPGQAQNFYTPVDQPYIVPRDAENQYFQKQEYVTFVVTVGDKTFESVLPVSAKRTKIAVKVLNVLALAAGRVKIAVSGVKKIGTNMKTTISRIKVTTKRP